MFDFIQNVKRISKSQFQLRMELQFNRIEGVLTFNEIVMDLKG
jgi:hypothetical protein